MKKFAFLLTVLACFQYGFSQVIKKYAISTTGCSAYFYCDPGNIEMSYSEDSSKVYTAECGNDGTNYGIICVQLAETVADINAAEDLLVTYLDYLKTTFKITSAAGYGKGHRLKNREDTRGIIDYWTDGDKNNWKVKGWTDGKFLAVLYAYSAKELNESKINLYLDGFRLPGM